jgi:hypothetical protein
MDYTSFCNALTLSLSSYLAPETNVHLQKIRKNNGILMDVLCFLKEGAGCSPMVYPDTFYREYLSGRTMEDICLDILAAIKKEPPFSDGFLDALHDFSSVRGRIAFRLISRDANSGLLNDIPWVPFLDLAMVFYLLLGSTASAQTTALIHNEQLSLWNLTSAGLYALAVANTPALFPASIFSLEELLSGQLPSLPRQETAAPAHLPAEDGSSPGIYVLTNSVGIHGAACLAYSDVLKNFADAAGTDLIILPSSIHEVLMIPDTHIYRYGEIREMIKKVNTEDVPAEDRLSDELYLYLREKRQLTVWRHDATPNTPEPGGKSNP